MERERQTAQSLQAGLFFSTLPVGDTEIRGADLPERRYGQVKRYSVDEIVRDAPIGFTTTRRASTVVIDTDQCRYTLTWGNHGSLVISERATLFELFELAAGYRSAAITKKADGKVSIHGNDGDLGTLVIDLPA